MIEKGNVLTLMFIKAQNVLLYCLDYKDKCSILITSILVNAPDRSNDFYVSFLLSEQIPAISEKACMFFIIASMIHLQNTY